MSYDHLIKEEIEELVRQNRLPFWAKRKLTLEEQLAQQIRELAETADRIRQLLMEI